MEKMGSIQPSNLCTTDERQTAIHIYIKIFFFRDIKIDCVLRIEGCVAWSSIWVLCHVVETRVIKM